MADVCKRSSATVIIGIVWGLAAWCVIPGIQPRTLFAQPAVDGQIAVPRLTRPVTDLTASLGPDKTRAIEKKIRALEKEKGSQIAVLILPTTGPETIEQFSLRVVEQWRLGRKNVDDGILLIVAKNDRKLRIEVGYGLEGAVPDAVARRIIANVITPRFKQGDFGGGIARGVDRLSAHVRGEVLPTPAATKKKEPKPQPGILHFLADYPVLMAPGFRMILFACVWYGLLMGTYKISGWFGVLPGSVIGGALAMVAGYFMAGFPWFILAGLALGYFNWDSSGGTNKTKSSDSKASSYGGSSYSSSSSSFSSYSSSSSSSSSSSGSYSGGGGSFGGGGASGSW